MRKRRALLAGGLVHPPLRHSASAAARAHSNPLPLTGRSHTEAVLQYSHLSPCVQQPLLCPHHTYRYVRVPIDLYQINSTTYAWISLPYPTRRLSLSRNQGLPSHYKHLRRCHICRSCRLRKEEEKNTPTSFAVTFIGIKTENPFTLLNR